MRMMMWRSCPVNVRPPMMCEEIEGIFWRGAASCPADRTEGGGVYFRSAAGRGVTLQSDRGDFHDRCFCRCAFRHGGVVRGVLITAVAYVELI